MTHSIVSYDRLQSDVEVLDNDLHQLSTDMVNFPLTTWIYHLKLRQMEWVVQLGFEQDIYLPDELGGMYLWLERLAASRVEVLEMLLPFFNQRGQKFVKKKKPARAAKIEEVVLHLQSLLHEARGTQALASALCKVSPSAAKQVFDLNANFLQLYVLLQYLNLVPTPNRPFSTPALRYELRMKSFLHIQSPALPLFEDFFTALHPYDDYATSAFLPHINGTYLAKAAELSIQEAKREFTGLKSLGAAAAKTTCVEESWKADVGKRLMSVIAAGVEVATVAKACGEITGKEEFGRVYRVETMETGRRYHDWWVVPKVVQR